MGGGGRGERGWAGDGGGADGGGFLEKMMFMMMMRLRRNDRERGKRHGSDRHCCLIRSMTFVVGGG